MKNFFKEYFSLNNAEQKGIITFLLLILFVFVGTRFYLAFQKPKEIVSTLDVSFKADEDNFVSKNPEEIGGNPKENFPKPQKQIDYFYFDPNTAPKEELLALGFPEKTANILINFRNKGGKFYKKEDLKNVYGVYDELYNNVSPYIQIEGKPVDIKPKKEVEEPSQTNEKTNNNTNYKAVLVNINTADSAALIKIKGIGPTYAKRIVKYRDLLGGFIRKEQLLEVYGLDQEKFDAIKEQITVSGSIQTISINTADWNLLKKHPYINNEVAGKIAKYREQNGSYKSIDDLVNKQIIPNDIYTKIKPYLSL